MEILFHDTHVAVGVKPAGVLSQGTAQDLHTAPGMVAQALGLKEIFPVHRLDRQTEGLMVFALTQKAAASLSQAMVEGQVQKQYLAKLNGVPDPLEGELTDLLFYDRRRNRAYTVDRKRAGVKEARLSYRVVEADAQGRTSTVRIWLHTGRTHQIRVQFASRRMPLLGDRAYGAPPWEGGVALRAVFLSFPHPHTGEMLTFELE